MLKRMPWPGEQIPLVCTECKNFFSGIKPDWGKKVKEICPKCGSKKVIEDPFILY